MPFNEIYKEKYKQNVLTRIADFRISSFHQNMYEDLNIQRLGLMPAEFAGRMGNHNPNRSNLGELAQLEIMAEKYPTLEKLPNGGKNSLYLGKNENNIDYIKIYNGGSDKDLCHGKSLDFYIPDLNVFVIAKTTNASPYSTNITGGHQDNVFSELANALNYTNEKNRLIYKGRSAHVWLALDGKNSPEICDKLRIKFNHNNIIKKIDSVDNL